jgi:protein-S-isoprenylcysteine O-methyltransferase Ste14
VKAPPAQVHGKRIDNKRLLLDHLPTTYIGMLENFWLVVRNLAMIILFPGAVLVYFPSRLLIPTGFSELKLLALDQIAALLLIICASIILLNCIWRFATIGKGTLAPFDETQQLIIVGPYRYVRNPMYVSVLLILLGEAWFFGSGRLLAYTSFCFIVANVFVIAYEENRLRNKYGEQYLNYYQNVRRWLPGRPYEEIAGTDL